ncbi:hypothetical protein DFH09DRAFT_1115517 [Mycena vulgaris]|nr:hypothetical protein DFH09DRAFT_1115517 [Mycena vulgaris]
MSQEMREALAEIFKENHSHFVQSLDAWTSSNGYAFMAIVIHYIGNDGKLDMFDPAITAFVMDNATNNDTMVEAFECRCDELMIHEAVHWGFHAIVKRVRWGGSFLSKPEYRYFGPCLNMVCAPMLGYRNMGALAHARISKHGHMHPHLDIERNTGMCAHTRILKHGDVRPRSDIKTRDFIIAEKYRKCKRDIPYLYIGHQTVPYFYGNMSRKNGYVPVPLARLVQPLTVRQRYGLSRKWGPVTGRLRVKDG